MKQIVVAIDGSEFSQQALAWAQELAGDEEENVWHLVHAYPVHIPVAASAHSFAHFKERAKEAAQALVAEARAAIGAGRIEEHICSRPPAAAVLDVAEQIEADLVVVGRRGLNPAACLLLGSVSSEILHRSCCPVLVVHDAPRRTIESVLVGVDESEHSILALRFAAKWLPGAEVTCLHVVPDTVSQVAERIVRDSLVRAGVRFDRLRVLGRAGNPVDVVVQEFREGEYDLAVVGRRGLGPVGELVLGSVSERLSRLVHGAVVVVK